MTDAFVQYRSLGTSGHVVFLSTDSDEVPVEIARAMGRIVIASTVRIYPGGCIEYVNPDWRPNPIERWTDRVVRLLQRVPGVRLLFVTVDGDVVYRNPDW